ncbi:MAG: hypothetical protein M1274_09865 [Actinobacteria bacterium]|nr:hypothetical protein [Actinomycetota bacterium]
MFRRKDVRIRGQHLVNHRVIRDLLDLLRQEADAKVFTCADLPAIERHLSRDEPKQCGLTGTIRPDQTNAHAGLDMQARAIENDLSAK